MTNLRSLTINTNASTDWTYIDNDCRTERTIKEHPHSESGSGVTLTLYDTKLRESIEQLDKLWKPTSYEVSSLSTAEKLLNSFFLWEESSTEQQWGLQLKKVYVCQLATLLADKDISQQIKRACLSSMARLIHINPNEVPDFRCHVAYLRCAKHKLDGEFSSAEANTIETMNRIFSIQFPDVDNDILMACAASYGFPLSSLDEVDDQPSPLNETQKTFYLQLVAVFYSPFYLARQFGKEQTKVLSTLLTDTQLNDEVRLLCEPNQLSVILCHADLQDQSVTSIQGFEQDHQLITFDSLYFAVQTNHGQFSDQLRSFLSPKFCLPEMPLSMLVPFLDSITEQILDYETAVKWAAYLNDYWVNSEHKWLREYCALSLCKQMQKCYDGKSFLPFGTEEWDTNLATLPDTLQRHKQLTAKKNIEGSCTLSQFLKQLHANQKLGLAIDNSLLCDTIINQINTLPYPLDKDKQPLIAFATLLDEQNAPDLIKQAFIKKISEALTHQKTVVNSATDLVNYQQTIEEVSALALFSAAQYQQQKPTFDWNMVAQLSIDELNTLSPEWLTKHYGDTQGLQILLELSIKLASEPLQDVVLSLGESISLVSWESALIAIDDTAWLAADPKFIEQLAEIVDQDDTPLFHVLISENRIALLTQWLTLSLLDFEQRDPVGNTSLHHACVQGNQHILNLLLQHGSTVLTTNQVNCCGDTALHVATQHEHLECVRTLLNREDTHVNAVNAFTGKTPLHYAVEKQNIELVTVFINKEARLLEIQDHEGVSPLALAMSTYPDLMPVFIESPHFDPNMIVYKQLSVIAYTLDSELDDFSCRLLQKFPSIRLNEQYLLHLAVKCPKAFEQLLPKLSAEINQLNPRGCAPLHQAATVGNASAIRQLIQAGANRQILTRERQNALFFSFQSINSTSVLKELLTQGVLIQSPDFTPLSLLKRAIISGNAEGLQYLLEKSLYRTRFIQAVLSDNSPLNLLHCAVEENAYSCVKYLSSSKQMRELNKTICKGEHRGLTPLMLSAKLNKEHSAKALTEVFPDAYTEINEQGYTAAHIAVLNSSIEALRVLMQANDRCLKLAYRVKGQTFRFSPWQLAAHLNLVKVVAEMLACAPDSIDQGDDRGFSVAHIATESHAHDVLKILPLLWLDYSVKKPPYQGYSCLHLAIEHNDLETLSLLTQLGVKIDNATVTINFNHLAKYTWKIGSAPFAPITLCAIRENIEAARILLQAGSEPLDLLDTNDWKYLTYRYSHTYCHSPHPIESTSSELLWATIVGDSSENNDSTS